jgi:hypothetical protein
MSKTHEDPVDYLQAADLLEDIRKDLSYSLNGLREGWYTVPTDHPQYKSRSKEHERDARRAAREYPKFVATASRLSKAADQASHSAKETKSPSAHAAASRAHEVARQAHVNAAGSMHVIGKYGSPSHDWEAKKAHHDETGGRHAAKAREHEKMANSS